MGTGRTDGMTAEALVFKTDIRLSNAVVFEL